MAIKSKKKLGEEKVEIPDTSEIKPAAAKDEQKKSASAQNLDAEASDTGSELPVDSALPKEPVLDVKEEEDEEDKEKVSEEDEKEVEESEEDDDKMAKLRAMKEEDEEEVEESEEDDDKMAKLRAMKEEDEDEEDKEKVSEESEEEKDEVAEGEDEEDWMEEEESPEDKKEDEKEVKEHIAALTRGKALSETFKKQTATVFAAAVKASVDRKKKKLTESLKRKLSEERKKNEKKLAERLSDYLDLVVEEYLKENKLPIEQGIRAEITESFMADLKGVFEKHNVDMPKSKVSVVEEQTKKIERLEKELNESLNTQVELKKALSTKEREEILSSLCEGLADTEAAKLRKLAESVSFEGKDNYQSAVKTLKESYFPSKPKKASDMDEKTLADGGVKPAEANSAMDLYIKAAEGLK